MLFRVPSYYNSFKCIADKCSDNCCIGWEIDIDTDTAEYYRSVGGVFGERLEKSISEENSFILKDERCPFLNSRSLCDIIINCGEEHLCQICRDHPRFFEWYGDVKEGGVGLSCEEAARLILTTERPAVAESFVDEAEEPVDDELFTLLLSAREELFEITDSKAALREKLCQVLDFAEKLQFIIDNRETDAEYTPCGDESRGDMNEVVALFASFEPVDEEWEKELSRLLSRKAVLRAPTQEEEGYMLNLLRYFIWRYFLKGVFDEEVLSKVKLAVVSVLFIRLMCDNPTLSEWVEKSKLYSKQMEYSDENRELFYDYTYEKECLSSDAIKGLIR